MAPTSIRPLNSMRRRIPLSMLFLLLLFTVTTTATRQPNRAHANQGAARQRKSSTTTVSSTRSRNTDTGEAPEGGGVPGTAPLSTSPPLVATVKDSPALSATPLSALPGPQGEPGLPAAATAVLSSYDSPYANPLLSSPTPAVEVSYDGSAGTPVEGGYEPEAGVPSTASDTAPQSSGLSGGAIAGIVLGGVAALALLFCGGWILGRWKAKGGVSKDVERSVDSADGGTGEDELGVTGLVKVIREKDGGVIYEADAGDVRTAELAPEDVKELDGVGGQGTVWTQRGNRFELEGCSPSTTVVGDDDEQLAGAETGEARRYDEAMSPPTPRGSGPFSSSAGSPISPATATMS